MVEATKKDIPRLIESVKMLKTYVTDEEVKPLIAVLEELIDNPEDRTLIKKLSDSLNKLGIAQGAVMTYAPYVMRLLSDDPFGNSK